MKSSAFAKKVISLAKSSRKVAISGHQNPDYDALGSCLAMQEILFQNGIKADIILGEPLDSTFNGFANAFEFVVAPQPIYDLVIMVDTAELKLVPPALQPVLNGAKQTVCIDHHRSHVKYTDLLFLEADKSSACEVIFNLFKKKFTLTLNLAKFFYIGIYTDTGGFVYSNTTKSTLLTLAKIMDSGLEAEKLLNDCFRRKSRQEFLMTQRAFQSVKFYHDNQIAVSVLREKDFVETSANQTESKFLTPYLPTIDGVKVGICVSEPKKGDFHVSLRTSFDDIDVSAIAQRFGGGGHKKASGLTLKGDFDKALGALITHTKKVIGNEED